MAIRRRHHIKSWPPFFKASAKGIKPFEFRLNDRNYMVGDEVILQEWSPTTKQYTGNTLSREITYILTDATWSMPEGWVILGLRDLDLTTVPHITFPKREPLNA